jgi:type III restriction enzyme
MPSKRRVPIEQQSLLEARVTTAPCVPSIRKAVTEWRKAKYRGVTGTTRLLLNHWFATDHRLPDGRAFRYYYSQREAVETLVYLYEVAEIRRHKDLLERFAPNIPGIHLLQYDQFARYAVKMATGSGKTKVMALVVAWQYFNAVAEGRDDYARSFLLIAPNVIVFERLRADFAGGRVFRTDPIIPPELRIFWDFDCYMRGDPERAASQGALYLTNIQQFYERRSSGVNDEPQAMTDVLGPKPPASILEQEDLDRRILARHAPCLVINDEGTSYPR